MWLIPDPHLRHHQLNPELIITAETAVDTLGSDVAKSGLGGSGLECVFSNFLLSGSCAAGNIDTYTHEDNVGAQKTVLQNEVLRGSLRSKRFSLSFSCPPVSVALCPEASHKN